MDSCSEKNNKENLAAASTERSVSKDTNSLPQFADSLTLVSSGQMSFYKTTFIDGIPFRLVKDSQGDTAFLATGDKSFITPEGYRVEMNNEQSRKL